jgi:hypothetical protein
VFILAGPDGGGNVLGGNSGFLSGLNCSPSTSCTIISQTSAAFTFGKEGAGYNPNRPIIVP